MNEIKISENFLLSELESPDTKEVKVDEKLVDKLEFLRAYVSKKLNRDVPLIVKSGYRTWEHHVSIYKNDYPNKWKEIIPENSLHLEGKAADIDVAGIIGITIDEFAELAEKAEFDGIGKYNTFVHVDVRKSGPARWDYR